MIYWDTSALIKLYVAEPDSAYYLSLVGTATGQLATSELARAEIYAALSRKGAAGALPPGKSADDVYARFENDTQARILTLPAGGDVLQQANAVIRTAKSAKPPMMIRSIDALQCCFRAGLRVPDDGGDGCQAPSCGRSGGPDPAALGGR